MKLHSLKTHLEAYRAVAYGLKRHEFRLDDRGFAVGDVLILRAYDPIEKAYLPEPALLVHVSYITKGPAYGVPERYVAMSISEPRQIDDCAVSDLACRTCGTIKSVTRVCSKGCEG